MEHPHPGSLLPKRVAQRRAHRSSREQRCVSLLPSLNFAPPSELIISTALALQTPSSSPSTENSTSDMSTPAFDLTSTTASTPTKRRASSSTSSSTQMDPSRSSSPPSGFGTFWMSLSTSSSRLDRFVSMLARRRSKEDQELTSSCRALAFSVARRHQGKERGGAWPAERG